VSYDNWRKIRIDNARPGLGGLTFFRFWMLKVEIEAS
jgi:hypothetical protein